MDFLARPAGRRVLFAMLYFSEGAPVGFIWYALPARLKSLGVAIDEVTGFTAVLVLPWALKFLWAPAIDACQTPRWTLRHWILAAQSVMVVTLLPLAWLDLATQRDLILRCLLVHAVAAATQDAAIDALCIRVTDVAERGRLNGWMQAGTLVGRALLGGGALILFDRLGQTGVVSLLAATTAVSALFVLKARIPPRRQSPDLPQTARFSMALSAALRLPWTWLGLGFALLGGAAFEALGAVTGPMLIDSGYSEQAVGFLQLLPVIAAMVAGSLTGGWLADRFGHLRVVAVALVVVALNVSAIGGCWWLLAGERTVLAVLVCSNAFGIGVFTASSYALLMDLTTPQAAATQFSTFMGATNGCEAWSGFVVGKLIHASGFAAGLPVMAGLSLLALPLLWLIRRTQQAVDWNRAAPCIPTERR